MSRPRTTTNQRTSPIRREHEPPGTVKQLAISVAVALASAFCLLVVGWTFVSLLGQSAVPWVLGRAAGLTSYALLVVLVVFGLFLAHPWRAKVSWPSTANRIRLHVSLAVFTLVFTVLHIVVLVTDQYAGVGIKGALLPMASEYRPLPVTFGLLGLYAGLLAGLTAMFASGFARKVWWPIHKFAVVSLILVWIHSVFAGTDSPGIMVFYIGSGLAVLAIAVSRYTAETPADRADLTISAPADRLVSRGPVTRSQAPTNPTNPTNPRTPR
ncbi:MAG: hypothetical protein WCP28_20105 [Actinomycetes bacterium]